MHDYVLIYRRTDGAQMREHAFRAVSFDNALEVAKGLVEGDWAELHEDGVPICRMQLADSGGLWRISSLGTREGNEKR